MKQWLFLFVVIVLSLCLFTSFSGPYQVSREIGSKILDNGGRCRHEES